MPKKKHSSSKPSSPTPSGNLFPSAFSRRASAGMAIIVVLTLLVYLPALSGGFILDDNLLLTANPLIHAPDGLYRFWCTTEPPDYWPVSSTSLWIEWRLWGRNPTGYHVTNLVLHLAAVMLVWIILRTLSIPGAFLAALIFAVHPVNVESVAWIAQRKNLLAMLFLLLSVLWYLKAERGERPGARGEENGRRNAKREARYEKPSPPYPLIPHPSPLIPRWYCLSLLAFVLAMLSKGSAAVLPALLLGIVWWRRPLTKRDFLRTAPFFAVAAVLTALNIWFQHHDINKVIRTADFIERLLGAGGVVWFYLYKALLPLDLAFIYPRWNIQANNLLWWLPLTAALALTAVLWRSRQGWSQPFWFAWFFFCVALVPVLGFTDVGFMEFSLVADHYQHIAILGVIALAAAGWSVWHQKARGQIRATAFAAAAAGVGALALLTLQQTQLYRSPVTLYQDTLKKNPECLPALMNLGNELVKADRLPEAISCYDKALGLQPDSPYLHENLGNALLQAGRPLEAIRHYERAIQLHRVSGAIYYNLARAYDETDQPAKALSAAQQALSLARSQNQTAQVRQIEKWISSYRAKKNNVSTPRPDER